MKQLILGGARSGKSRLAERLATRSAEPVTYIATAEALDEEMKKRIAHHRRQRPSEWRTIEEPLALSAIIEAHDNAGGLLLIDCLTLWLSNVLHRHAQPETTLDAFCHAVARSQARLIMVSNETGLGIIPADRLSRRFVDLAGRLHQQLASECESVLFCVAGLTHTLKGTPPDA